MTCAYPLCSRPVRSGLPTCWPCWATERELRHRKIPCERCGEPASIKRHLTPRIVRILCLGCGRKTARDIDFLRSYAGPQKPVSEIEEQYAWMGVDR